MGIYGWIVVLVCAVLFTSESAGASGFTVYDFGAAEQAQGDAVAAQVDAPSAVFYNPAGLIGLPGTQLQVGTTIVFPKTVFDSDVTGANTEPKSGPIFPTYFFASRSLGERVGVGFGFFTASGDKVEYPKAWEGRFFLTSAELRQFNFAPAVAVRILPNVSMGASVVFTYADIQRGNQIDLSLLGSPTEGSFDLTGSGYGVNATVGIKADLGPSWSLGAVYKSPTTIAFDGDGKFQVPALLSSLFPNGGVRTTLPVPQMAIIGLANRSVPNLTLEADLQWTNWNAFDSQKVVFDQKSLAVQDTVMPFNWRDTWTVRVGGHYNVNDFVTLRAGYIFDPSAVPGETLSPLLPEPNKHTVTIGIGIRHNPWAIDLLYGTLITEARRANNALPGFSTHRGRYTSFANAGGISIRYRF